MAPGAKSKPNNRQKGLRESSKLSKVKFGDIIKPNFSETGEMLGFDLRHELAPMMFSNNDYNMEYLNKLIKTTMYMNRLLREGQQDEFFMKQVQGNEVIDGVPVAEYTETEVQVDVESLKNNAYVENDIFE